MISLTSVAKAYGELEVLKDISFSIAQGERVSVVGPGGCGKSTVLKILLGLEDPDQGEVQLMGNSLVGMKEEEKFLLMRSVGMAFQQGGLFDFMTIKENLFFAMEHMTSLTHKEMHARGVEMLEGVKLGRTLNMYPHELSGGMVRRVGIARALCTEPEVAIFDEPTSGLDPVTSTIILDMISELSAKKAGATLLVATSNVEIAIRFSSRIIIINNGVVVADGPWKELLVHGDDWVKNFLGIRFIGLDLRYAKGLQLPQEFIDLHW